MQGPRADFACLSPKCKQDGASTVYELPVAAKRCPVCGSKRISRLYNAVNVASGIAKKVDAIVEPAHAQAMEARGEAKAARTAHRAAPALAVPISQVSGTLARMGLGMASLPAGGSRPTSVPAHPAMTQIGGHAPQPAPNSLRDREFKIVGGQVVRS